MKAMRPDLFAIASAFLLCLSIRADAQPISVTFEGGNFSKGPSVSQVRELARSILKDRVVRYDRCNVRLKTHMFPCHHNALS